MAFSQAASRQEPQPRPRRFIFVLMQDFTLLSFASALEALRLANRMSGTRLFDWRIVGEGGGTARCSAGTAFALDGDLPELSRDDTVLLCGGTEVAAKAVPNRC